MTDKTNRIQCHYCGSDTGYSGTGMCDGCWELDKRINASPSVAVKILAARGTFRPDPLLCPEDVVYAFNQYVHKGVPPGNFVYQVLSNNLREAYAGADDKNTALMMHIVAYAWNYLPSIAWGSRSTVDAIINAGGLASYLAQFNEKPQEPAS